MTGVPLRGRHRAVAAVVTMLFLLLPALVGGVGIDSPPRPGEQARLLAALHPQAPATRSLPADSYYLAAVSDAEVAPASAQALGRARLASVFGLLAISGLGYFAISMGRGRATGLLSCAGLACLPPVVVDGAVLRPEVPASVFGLLSLLLLVGFPAAIPTARTRRAFGRWARLLLLAAAVGVTLGLAVTCLPATGIELLVPGGLLVLVVGLHLVRMTRLWHRRGVWRLPLAALTHRLLPWALLCVIVILAVLMLLRTAVEGEPADLQASLADVGLLPAALPARLAILGLAAIGALRLLLALGLRFGRRRRIEPGTVLGIYAAVMLMQRVFTVAPVDALPAAVALALLTAEGVMVVLIFAIGFAVRTAPQ